MVMIKLIDARKGLYEKCIELFHDEKIAKSIYMYLCDGLEECDVLDTEYMKILAIEYLQSIGWLQDHDRILTESAKSDLIRCRECEFWDQGRCDLMQSYPSGNWFCANAHRKVVDEVKNK